MTTIRHHLEAACPPAALWALLAELDAVQQYNPTVRVARVLDGPRVGVGARRECELVPSGRVVERVTAWEEGRALGLEIAESDWPITFMRWTTRVGPREGGSTVDQDLEYEVKFGLAGRVLDALVMRRKLQANLDAVLAAFVAKAEQRASTR